MDSKYKVRVSAAAKDDLDEIFTYFAEKLYTEKSADKLMAEFQRMTLSLDENPQRFSYSLDPVLAQKGYRRALVRKYVILFLIDEETKTVSVMRVFHGSMDYARYI